MGEQQPLVTQQEQLFDDITIEHPEYHLPNRRVLPVPPEQPAVSGATPARASAPRRQSPAPLRVQARVIRQPPGPLLGISIPRDS